MRISLWSKDWFKVYSLELTEISRNLRKKAVESPVLYLWFSIIIAFSVIMTARLTVFEMDAKFPVDMEQIFLAAFFLFMLKSSADMHRYFISSDRIEYLFSSPVKRFSVPAGVFSGIFWINMGLWSLFVPSYIALLRIYGIPVGYPLLFVKFTLGVALSIVLGTAMAVHYFSPRRYLIIVPALFISALWYFHTGLQVFLILLASLPYLIWVLHISPQSFRYMVRKERSSTAKYSVIERDPVNAMLWKEITVLWRDRLVSSFIFTSAIVGFISGYLAVNIDTDLFPPEIRPRIIPHLPFIFMFLGTFIIASYLFVFPALNAFLSEEKTLWLLKNLPVSGKDIVSGKSASMTLPLLASLSFPFYFIIYTGAENLLPGFFMLFMAFFLSIAISLPFGIRYAGRKSDVMLLYSVSILIFTVLATGSYALKNSLENGFTGMLVAVLMLDWSAFILYLSVHFSGKMMDRKWV